MRDEAFKSGMFLFGDCLERMKEVATGSVDMILCDLPYGTTACAWDQVIPFEPLWREYWRVCKPNAAVVLTASQPFTSALVMSQPGAFKVEWIWRKNAGSNFAQMKSSPMKEHESVLVFGQGKVTYNAMMQERAEAGKRMVKTGFKNAAKEKPSSFVASNKSTLHTGFDSSHLDPELRYPSSVQNFNRERGLHPTQKPVALFEYLIKTYTNPGELVLDNCAGSGTTAIAAEQSGRRWVCIEREEKYFDKAVERVQAYLAPKPQGDLLA